MKLNQKLIQQLRNGKIAAESDGTLEQLREVIKAAFPYAPYYPNGSFKFYQRDTDDKRVAWDFFNKTTLPIISVSDFYEPELFTGWAKDDQYPNWMAYFKDDIFQYGFDGCEYEWISGFGMCRHRYSSDEYNRPATHEEILSTLIKEAKRRGYKKGVTCLFGKDKEIRKIEGKRFVYSDELGVFVIGDDVIFTESTGQWAEIIEQPSRAKPKTNPIKYLVDYTEYSLDYQNLKFRYEDICQYSDQQFLDELPQIAHLACVVAYFKGLGVQATISDKGIIHELIHLMTEPNEPANDLQEIREKFNRLIQLV